MTNQYIYGYRLSHEDGSRSRWTFINDDDHILTLRIKLKNGARFHFSKESEFVYNWASNRRLEVERCQFEVRGAAAPSWEQIEFYPVTGA